MIEDEARKQAEWIVRMMATQGPQWKPDSGAKHLAKRIKLKHLPPDCTMENYHAMMLGS